MVSDLKRKREDEPDEEEVDLDAESAKVLVSQTIRWRF